MKQARLPQCFALGCPQRGTGIGQRQRQRIFENNVPLLLTPLPPSSTCAPHANFFNKIDIVCDVDNYQ